MASFLKKWGKPLAVGGAIGITLLVMKRYAQGAVNPPSGDDYIPTGPQRAEVVVMGDSLASGLGLQLQRLVSHVAVEAEIGEAPSLTADRAATRLAGKRAGAVVIWTGANWLHRPDKTAEQIAVEVDGTVAVASRTQGVQKVVVVGQTLAPGAVYVGKAVEVNAMLASSYAHEPRIAVVEVPRAAYSFLQASDQLHFRPDGYRIVAEAVEAAL